MLGLLGRHDQVFPEKAVRVFVSNMVHDSLQVRKVSCYLFYVLYSSCSLDQAISLGFSLFSAS